MNKIQEAEHLELAEAEVARLIQVCHYTLNYWQILDIFLHAVCDLHLRASAEYQAKGGR